MPNTKWRTDGTGLIQIELDAELNAALVALAIKDRSRKTAVAYRILRDALLPPAKPNEGGNQ